MNLVPRPISFFAFALAVVAASCGGGSSDSLTSDDVASVDIGNVSTPPSSVAPTTSAAPIEDGPKATFTGQGTNEELSAQPAVVVKVSNNDQRSRSALVGIEHADIVLEERIEDRATRFAAIFHSDLPELVGPVRSARTTDLDLLANLGNPALVFSGANIAVLRELRDFAADGLAVLVVNDDSETYHYRDLDFRAPDNLFTNPSLVLQDFRDSAGAATPILSFRDTESDTRPASVEGPGVTVEGRDTVNFVFDPARGYVRVQDGEVHATRDGHDLVVTNVVLMDVEYLANVDDPLSVDAVTVGSGPASVLIGGRRWSGTWERVARSEPYTFRTDGGAEILLEPGQSWLTMVPSGSYEFSVSAEISSLVLN